MEINHRYFDFWKEQWEKREAENRAFWDALIAQNNDGSNARKPIRIRLPGKP